MFRGVNELSLDDKGRMAMPSRYREHLSDEADGKLVLTIDTDERCLLIYPLPDWEVIERQLDALPSLDPQARRIQRLLLGHATETDMDSHGRLLVSPPLRKFAGLDKQVVLMGQGKKFELWDAELWNRRRDEWLAEETVGEEGLHIKLQSLSL